MVIAYLIASFCIVLLTCYLYIKIKLNFWSIQPVFHIYNLRYWLYPPGIIQHQLPPKNKYYNWLIKCDKVENITLSEQEQLYFLIKTHYLRKETVQYNPSISAVLEYFKHHNTSPFISLQYQIKTLQNNTNITYEKRLIACMTSRRLIGKLVDKPINVSYVDFLCVHKKHRKSGKAPMQIYTHYHKSREKGADPIFLFKREGNVNFMVPVTIYNAYAFSITKWKTPNFNFPNNISCVQINTSNIELLFYYFKEIKQHFPCFLMPYYTNFKNLIKFSLIIPYILLDKQTPVGVYIYRYPNTSYNGQDSIECIASYCSKGYMQIFQNNFVNTIILLKKKYRFSIFLIENISYNTHLLKLILSRDVPKWECPMAYYFYNFAIQPFFSPNVMIIS